VNIADVIGWKFNHQAGMQCKEIEGVLAITGFPGGIPSQADQDAWIQEYSTWIASGGQNYELADIQKQFNQTLKAFALVVLDEINILRTEAGLSARTPAQVKTAIKSKL